MHVVATAGHVDHGKSALIKALTGMEPDRWAAERSRGMSIDLGFCWTSRDGESIAFVDVPGHERFLSNALAGVGCCEAVILVVAADEGWMPQTFEHLDALNALGIRSGVVAVSRSDLADPGPMLAETRERLGGTSLEGIPVVAVSAVTGQGLEDLLAALTPQLIEAPLVVAPARMWIDRSFSVRGAGTVVTGALCSGQITNGDNLFVPRLDRQVEIRGLHCLGEPVGQAAAFCRVAINLRRVPAEALHRGDALVAPEHWLAVTSVDVRVHDAVPLPREILVHVGTAKVTAVQRKLGADTIRLRLSTPLPLHIGDRLALRAAGSRSIVGATVLDPEPAPLAGRGAAARRGKELADATGSADDGAAALRVRKVASTGMLTAIGVTPPGDPVTGDWHVDPVHAIALRDNIHRLVTAADTVHRAISVEAIQQRLGLPHPALVASLLPDSVQLDRGELRPVSRQPLPATTLRALNLLPQHIVDSEELSRVGLRKPQMNAVIEHGLLVRVGVGFMLSDAMTRAVEALTALDQPFTVSQAREALGVSRRHTLLLLEHLDATAVTRCEPDRTRRMSA